MEIYNKRIFVVIDTKLVEKSHTLYSTFGKAKTSVKEYIDDDIKNLDNYEYKESQSVNGNEVYRVSISWDGYHGNRIHEVITITKEYVY